MLLHDVASGFRALAPLDLRYYCFCSLGMYMVRPAPFSSLYNTPTLRPYDLMISYTQTDSACSSLFFRPISWLWMDFHVYDF
jgi:hypothetical protein